MDNKINNNINFTAKLHISALTNNKSRWKKIATEFERQTLKFKDDALVLTNDNELEICKHYGPKITTTYSRFQELFLTNECTQKLMQLSDEKIAKKLAEILKIFKKEEETSRVYSLMAKTGNSANKSGKTNIDKDLVSKILDAIKQKIRLDTTDSIASDSTLRNGIRKYWSFYAD